jgi:hypothetical protein
MNKKKPIKGQNPLFPKSAYSKTDLKNLFKSSTCYHSRNLLTEIQDESLFYESELEPDEFIIQ